jgi:4-hydroxythreonine-4-phosphate dehydrogenase
MGGAAAGMDAPLGVTMGDPCGIGPEITLRAYQHRRDYGLAPFAVYGTADVFTDRARMLGFDTAIETVNSAQDARSVFARALPVIAGPISARAVPGVPDAKTAPATIAAIERAVADAAAGHIRAVVTNPIAKAVLYEAGFQHPGHTEFLAELASRHWPGKHYHPVMMLASEPLKVVPLTIHIPLKSVPPLITRGLILETVYITSEALRRDFGIPMPRIAVAGLNPHAGEGGSIGTEDRDIIAPAIRDLVREGLAVTGPHSADTLFHAEARRAYDAVVAMYHDQALIPIKTLAFDDGVNVTLGLPFVRTSPDHGTAFDIAAKGTASAASLIAAIKMADAIATRRKATAA